MAKSPHEVTRFPLYNNHEVLILGGSVGREGTSPKKGGGDGDVKRCISGITLRLNSKKGLVLAAGLVIDIVDETGEFRLRNTTQQLIEKGVGKSLRVNPKILKLNTSDLLEKYKTEVGRLSLGSFAKKRT